MDRDTRDLIDQRMDEVLEEIRNMEELLESKILECSCYRKWLHIIFKETQEAIAHGGFDPEWVSKQVQGCLDEIELIKDQRR